MKYESNIVVSGLLFSCAGFFLSTAIADEVIFTPRASLSIAAYEFSQTARPGTLAPAGVNNDDFPEVKFDVIFKVLGRKILDNRGAIYVGYKIGKSEADGNHRVDR